MNPHKIHLGRAGFSLVELLVVIAIIGALAAFTLSARSDRISKPISITRAEMAQIQVALENYHANYGVYPPSNQRPPANYPLPSDRALFSQLYYELTGTTLTADGVNFVTLGGDATVPDSTIPVASVPLAYGVGGFINCTKGSAGGEVAAKNFLLSLKTRQYHYPVNNSGSGTDIPTSILIASVGGPDESYQPLNVPGVNPIRYVCPGIHNPTGYDLWVQLVIRGKTNLVCNWTKNVEINTAYR